MMLSATDGPALADVLLLVVLCGALLAAGTVGVALHRAGWRRQHRDAQGPLWDQNVMRVGSKVLYEEPEWQFYRGREAMRPAPYDWAKEAEHE